MQNPTVAIINRSTLMTDATLALIVEALQVQVDRDFGPVWDQGAYLLMISKAAAWAAPPSNAWIIAVHDTITEQDALGFHELTKGGFPVSYVSLKDDPNPSVTLSHELLEMLGDPRIDQTVFQQLTDTTGVIWAKEMCDACEDDSFSYDIGNVLVSDFVTRYYFQNGPHRPGTKFSFRANLPGPFTIGIGGYSSVFPVEPGTAGWSQRLADGPAGRRTVKGALSRTIRRRNYPVAV